MHATPVRPPTRFDPHNPVPSAVPRGGSLPATRPARGRQLLLLSCLSRLVPSLASPARPMPGPLPSPAAFFLPSALPPPVSFLSPRPPPSHCKLRPNASPPPSHLILAQGEVGSGASRSRRTEAAAGPPGDRIKPPCPAALLPPSAQTGHDTPRHTPPRPPRRIRRKWLWRGRDARPWCWAPPITHHVTHPRVRS